jgi:hypothetical protein
MAEDVTSYPIREDNGLWEIGDGVPGPAGAASVDLGDDLRLTVDVAEPSLVVNVVATAADRAVRARLELVIPGLAPGRRSITIADAGVLDRLGRLAVLEDAAGEQAVWGEPSGWWDAEAVLLRAQAPPGLALNDGLQTRARRAGAVLAADVDGLEPIVGDRGAVAAALAAVLEPLDGEMAAPSGRRAPCGGPARRSRTKPSKPPSTASSPRSSRSPRTWRRRGRAVTRGGFGARTSRRPRPSQLPAGLAAAGLLRLVVGPRQPLGHRPPHVPPTLVAPQLRSR